MALRQRISRGRMRIGYGRILGEDVERSKQRKTAGISMEIGRSAHRSDFSIAEKAAHRERAQFFLEQPGVVAPFSIEVFPPSQAGKQQGPRDLVMSRAGLIR